MGEGPSQESIQILVQKDLKGGVLYNSVASPGWTEPRLGSPAGGGNPGGNSPRPGLIAAGGRPAAHSGEPPAEAPPPGQLPAGPPAPAPSTPRPAPAPRAPQAVEQPPPGQRARDEHVRCSTQAPSTTRPCARRKTIGTLARLRRPGRPGRRRRRAETPQQKQVQHAGWGKAHHKRVSRYSCKRT